MNSSVNICYNCGGEFRELQDRMVCRSCGAYKPKAATSEEISLLYSAFQKLRLAEFQDAEQEFDDIICRHPGNAYAYWGRLLSRHGIKYEEDHDGKRIPTCYALTIDSILETSDYAKAMEYADPESKEVFRAHAEYMERVREEWQKKAAKEKPYDIFISYKDSDGENGREHTVDSDELRELYFFLMRKGYRVFFSRETLLDKAGEKYEPYIYGALSTAKIMLVYGSKPEYVNSTWVKNEWSRYQKRIQSGEKHPDSLIVAYKGFSPKELPISLSSLGRQHIDASRPSFYSDLTEAVNRVLESVNRVRLNSEGGIVCEHREVIVPAKEPTCTQSGWTESAHCALCGDVLKPLAIIPAKGHCFGEWHVCKKATCTKDGEYVRVCECGEKETKPIPSGGGHVISDEWETVKEASVGKEGLRARKCVVCGEHVEEMIVPALPDINRKPSQGLRYKINADKETCEIVGCGQCRDEELVIPETIDGYRVISISKGAFKERDRLTGVFIPDSVRLIGDYAFSGCRNLTSVVIGDSVTDVGIYAFYHCRALASVKLGASVESVGTYAFYECNSLTGVVIPDSVKMIGGQAFGFCTNLSSAVIGESVTSIGASAFRGCKNLLRVHIPGAVRTIGGGAFSGGVSEFRVSAMNARYSSVEGHLCSADQKTLFQYATGRGESSFVLPASVETVESEAFRDCSALIAVTLTETVSHINKDAFKNCKNLSSLTYQGKKKQWKKVSLHGEWKADTAICCVSCVDGVIKLK